MSATRLNMSGAGYGTSREREIRGIFDRSLMLEVGRERVRPAG